MKKIKLTNILASFEDGLSVAIICLICFAVFFQVLSRFILKVPLSWTEELSRFSLVWLTFISASVALRNNGHFAVDVLSHKLSENNKKHYRTGVLVIMLCYLLVIFYMGMELLPIANMQESAALDVNMAYIYLSIPIGSLLMIFNVLIKIKSNIKSNQQEIS